jgi:hypothetical protein
LNSTWVKTHPKGRILSSTTCVLRRTSSRPEQNLTYEH